MPRYGLYFLIFGVFVLAGSSCVPMKKYKEALYEADLVRANQVNSGQRNQQLQTGFQDLRRDTLHYGELYRELQQKYIRVADVEKKNTAQLKDREATLKQTQKALAETQQALAQLERDYQSRQRTQHQKKNRIENELEDELRTQEKLVKGKSELLKQTKTQYEQQLKEKENRQQQALEQEEERHQRALEQKEQRHQQALQQKEKMHQEALIRKEKAHEQALSQKEKTHEQALNRKEKMHQEALTRKEKAHEQALSQKEKTHQQALAQKERVQEQALAQKEKAHEQVLAQKEKAQEQTLKSLEKQLEIQEKELEMLQGEERVVKKAATDWREELKQGLKEYQKDYQIQTEKGQTVLSIAEPALFDPLQWTLLPKGEELLAQIAVLLKKNLEKKVVIVGHTDNLKLPDTSVYKDNWELSWFKAKTIMEVLTNTYEVNPKQIITAGGGEFHTVAENRNFKGRVRNRRTALIFW